MRFTHSRGDVDVPTGLRRQLMGRLGALCAAGAVVAASLAVASPAHAVPSACGLAAHRGDRRTATENGVRAMQQAVLDGSDYIELDLRFTRDGYPFLMHDATVD